MKRDKVWRKFQRDLNELKDWCGRAPKGQKRHREKVRSDWMHANLRAHVYGRLV